MRTFDWSSLEKKLKDYADPLISNRAFDSTELAILLGNPRKFLMCTDSMRYKPLSGQIAFGTCVIII